MFNTDNTTHIAAPDDAAISVIITSDHKTSNIEGGRTGRGRAREREKVEYGQGVEEEDGDGDGGGELNG